MSKSIDRDSVLDVMSRHIGKGRGITVQGIVWEITKQVSSTACERSVRKVITELRLEGYHICASPAHGYFMAANDNELAETCKFLMDRGMTSITQVARMKKISMPDLYGQMKLLN